MDREVYAPIVSEETMRKLIKKLDDVSLRSQIVDNLTTASDTKALSANMGKKLQDEKLSIANLASTLGQQTNTAPTNKAVDDAISSLSDAINAISNYSTSEKVVGKWTDGSTLYSKTIIETRTQEGDSIIEIGVPFDKVRKIDAYMAHSVSYGFHPYYWSATDNFIVYMSTTRIVFSVKSSRDFPVTCYGTVYYVK